jgi:hypothetical protein
VTIAETRPRAKERERVFQRLICARAFDTPNDVGMPFDDF